MIMQTSTNIVYFANEILEKLHAILYAYLKSKNKQYLGKQTVNQNNVTKHNISEIALLYFQTQYLAFANEYHGEITYQQHSHSLIL